VLRTLEGRKTQKGGGGGTDKSREKKKLEKRIAQSEALPKSRTLKKQSRCQHFRSLPTGEGRKKGELEAFSEY